MAPNLSHQIFGAFLLFLFLVLQPFIVESTRPLNPESLQNLVGAEKGDTLNGLYQVKQYLKAFGYYPNGINIVSDHNDHFDDILESALKAFQQNYHLKVTGKIAPDTIKAIVTPRCGVPDIIPNQTRIFHLVANYTFFSGSPRWYKYQLTYTFLPGIQVVNLQVLRPIIARAFQKWAAVSQFRFQEATPGTRADIGIGFFKYSHGDSAPFDGPGGYVAHAYAPPDGRFHYDATENWSPNPIPGSNQMDLESVAVHEIGHLLGLFHSQDQAAIMYPTIPVGTTKRNLGLDDINGIRVLYS